MSAFHCDKKALRFIDPETLANAFLHCEERKVDKAGCISFQGLKYEVSVSFVESTVDVIYNPADTSQLTIECEGHKPWTAKQLVIGERSGPRPTLPPHMQPESAQSSRLLTAAEKQNEQRKAVQIPAVSYRTVKKDGEDRV